MGLPLSREVLEPTARGHAIEVRLCAEDPENNYLPAAGELILADRLLLTLGGCAANVAVGLAKMGVAASVAGRVGAVMWLAKRGMVGN